MFTVVDDPFNQVTKLLVLRITGGDENFPYVGQRDVISLV